MYIYADLKFGAESAIYVYIYIYIYACIHLQV